MTDDGEGTGREMRMEPPPAPEATPDQLSIALVWEKSGDAFLRGILTATNVSDEVATASGKPNIRPLGADGQQLASQHRITREGRFRPWTVIAPGERASARVSWSGWDGTPSLGDIEVVWPGGVTVIRAVGPPHPGRAEQPMTTSSSWWGGPLTLADLRSRDARPIHRGEYYLDEHGVRHRSRPEASDS